MLLKSNQQCTHVHATRQLILESIGTTNMSRVSVVSVLVHGLMYTFTSCCNVFHIGIAYWESQNFYNIMLFITLAVISMLFHWHQFWNWLTAHLTT